MIRQQDCRELASVIHGEGDSCRGPGIQALRPGRHGDQQGQQGEQPPASDQTRATGFRAASGRLAGEAPETAPGYARCSKRHAKRIEHGVASGEQGNTGCKELAEQLGVSCLYRYRRLLGSQYCTVDIFWRNDFRRQENCVGKNKALIRRTEQGNVFEYWWRIRDSNPGPADYDSVALTD